MNNKITISEILEKEGITLSRLAEKTGLNISLLSKIKNNNNPITNATRKKFKETYPNYELTNGCIYWKEMFLQQVEINYQLGQENRKLRQDAKDLIKAIKYFYTKYEKE